MPKKPWTKMTTEDLARATRAFDRGAGPPASAPAPTQAAKHIRAMAAATKPRRGRPRLGSGAARVLFTIDPELLQRLDAFARDHGMKRSNLIAASVEAYMAASARPRSAHSPPTADRVPSRRSA